jgi:hypothetical protein
MTAAAAQAARVSMPHDDPRSGHNKWARSVVAGPCGWTSVSRRMTDLHDAMVS